MRRMRVESSAGFFFFNGQQENTDKRGECKEVRLQMVCRMRMHNALKMPSR